MANLIDKFFKARKKEETPEVVVEVSKSNVTPAGNVLDESQERNSELWNRYWALKAQKTDIDNAISTLQDELVHRAVEQDLFNGKTARFHDDNVVRLVSRETLGKARNLNLDEFFEEERRWKKYSSISLNEKQIIADLKSENNEELVNFGFELKESTSYQFVKS